MPATPSAEVTLQVAANSAAAQLEMFSRKFKQMQKEMADATKKTAQEGKQAGNGFASWSSDIVKASVAIYAMHAPIKAMQTAVSMITAELENTIRISEGFKNRQIPYQQQLVNLMHSLPANEDKEIIIPALDSMIRKSPISNKEALLKVVESAASSTVGMPYLERAEVAQRVAESRQDLLETDPASLEALAKAVVYNHKAFQELGSTTEAQQGILQSAKAASLIQDNQQFYKTIGMLPGQIRSAYGDNYNQAEMLAVANAINIASGDTEGPVTVTQTFNMLADIITKLQRAPEYLDKTFMEQRGFIASQDPRAEVIRKELLAAMEERDGALSDEEALLVEMALAGDPEAFRMFKDKPDFTGRARSRFVAMNLFQPDHLRVKVREFDAYGILKTLLEGEPGKPGLGEMPIVLNSSGTIDDKRTYQEAAKLIRDRDKFAAESPLFKEMRLEQDMKVAQENIKMHSGSIRGQYQNVVDTLMNAAGPGSTMSSNWPKTYYQGGIFSPFQWEYSWQQSESDVGKFFKRQIAQQLRAVIARGYGELPTKEMPGENRYGWLDRQVMRSPLNIAREFERRDGKFGPEEASYFGLSANTLEKMKALFDLHRKIESFEEKAKQALEAEKQRQSNLSFNSMIPSVGSPTVQLDAESRNAVRQVFESVSMLMGFLAPAISGEKPLAVKDSNKPRTEPAKGDWAP
jgi:hypothetical protein